MKVTTTRVRRGMQHHTGAYEWSSAILVDGDEWGTVTKVGRKGPYYLNDAGTFMGWTLADVRRKAARMRGNWYIAHVPPNAYTEGSAFHIEARSKVEARRRLREKVLCIYRLPQGVTIEPCDPPPDGIELHGGRWRRRGDPLPMAGD